MLAIASEAMTTTVEITSWTAAGSKPPMIAFTAEIQPGWRAADESSAAHATNATARWTSWSAMNSPAGHGVQARPRCSDGWTPSCRPWAAISAAAAVRRVRSTFERSMSTWSTAETATKTQPGPP